MRITFYDGCDKIGGNKPNALTVFQVGVPAFACPSNPDQRPDYRAPVTSHNNARDGYSNYVTNYLVFGNPEKGSGEGSTRFSDITDGRDTAISNHANAPVHHASFSVRGWNGAAVQNVR